MDKTARKYVLLDKLESESLGFERLLITLATGTIVLSVTFLQFLTQDIVAQSILIYSWVTLALSVIFGLTDRLLFIHSISEHPYLYALETADEHAYQKKRWLSFLSYSEKISWLQVLFFMSGLILLLTFAIMNTL